MLEEQHQQQQQQKILLFSCYLSYSEGALERIKKMNFEMIKFQEQYEELEKMEKEQIEEIEEVISDQFLSPHESNLSEVGSPFSAIFARHSSNRRCSSASPLFSAREQGYPPI